MRRTAPLALLLLLLCGCRQALQHGLDEGQANEIEALLHEAGIDAKKVREGGRDAKWSVEVPERAATAALKLLTDHGLPRERSQGFGEVFGKGSMVPTAVEENALFLHALSGELSRTLSGLEGVVSARVHVVANPSGPPSALRQPVQPRASALLKVRAGRLDLLTARKSELQALVAGSVEGLAPENVSVMLTELPVPPQVVPGAEPPSRAPLLGAGVLVALLSGLVAFGVLYTRRLKQQLALAAAAPPPTEPAPT